MTDPTPDVPAVPAAPAGEIAPAVPSPPKGKGLGVFALILGLGTLIADIVLIVVIVAQLASALANFDYTNLGSSLLGLGGWAAIGVIAFFGGLVTGLLAVILGLVAAVKARGRVAGIFAIVFGVIVAGARLITLATAGGLIGQLMNAAG